MTTTKLIEEIKGMSESNLVMVLDFIKMIKSKEKVTPSRIVFDSMKGRLKYIADDFDETPECFKEYT